MNIIFSKDYRGLEIVFSSDSSQYLYLNATKVAKYFNKDLSNWRRNSETIVYIEALLRFVESTELKLSENELFIVVIGKGKKQGTWIHQKLIIAFARWLSPEFAVWCDMTIEEILTSKTQTFQKPHLPEIGNSTQKIIELDNNLTATEKLIANLQNMNPTTLYRLDKFYRKFHNFSPLAYFGIDLDSQFFLPTELGKMINKSPVEINLMIEHKGFQIRENGVWKLTESGRDFGILIVGKYNQIKWKIKSIV